jgi:transposase
VIDGTALWFGAAGFEVLDVVDDGIELAIDVETERRVVGCSGCGTRAMPKDRRWVTLRDVPAGRRFVRVRWRKRIWRCPEADCEVTLNTWTEQADLAEPRQVLTTRAAEWATDRVAAVEGTAASIARNFGLSWSTVWPAVECIGNSRLKTPAEIGPAKMVGFDETVMSPTSRRRPRCFVTAVVDVGSGRLLDVFEGRDVKHLRAWMATMPALAVADQNRVAAGSGAIPSTARASRVPTWPSAASTMAGRYSRRTLRSSNT